MGGGLIWAAWIFSPAGIFFLYARTFFWATRCAWIFFHSIFPCMIFFCTSTPHNFSNGPSLTNQEYCYFCYSPLVKDASLNDYWSQGYQHLNRRNPRGIRLGRRNPPPRPRPRPLKKVYIVSQYTNPREVNRTGRARVCLFCWAKIETLGRVIYGKSYF